MKNKHIIWIILAAALIIILGTYLYTVNPGTSDENDTSGTSYTSTSPSPSNPVRLIFIHHSVGESWLSDEEGGLGIALRDNNYFVSDTYYGWGPDDIGDSTDIGNWWDWFRGPESSNILNALYEESSQNSDYSHLSTNPGGENEIIVFKSCYPNSDLRGDPDDPVPSIDNNPLKSQDYNSEYHTVANAKGIYIDLLEYFKTRQDKLFIVVTAPPLSEPANADNARVFNQWLVNDWLKDYPYDNVAVFDYYSILTNGGNKLAYSSGDDYPNAEGQQKATEEFVNFLNNAYNQWKNG